MKTEDKKASLLDQHVGCFGRFDIADPICIRHCAIKIRCVIERDQNTQFEVIEDLFSAEDAATKLQ